MTAFYAFCHEVRKIVATVSDTEVASKKLDWWRHEICQTYIGKPTHPVTQTWLPLAQEFKIAQGSLQSVIEGCEFDLHQTRYLDYQNLTRYCHLVSATVGEVFVEILHPCALPEDLKAYAHKLWQAFELIEIIRRVGEDALRGRIYLPITELQQFDVKAHEILNRTNSPRFQALMHFQAARAHALCDEALSLLPVTQWAKQKPSLIMASLTRALLREIQARQFPILTQRVALTPLRKRWLAWKMQALGRF